MCSVRCQNLSKVSNFIPVTDEVLYKLSSRGERHLTSKVNTNYLQKRCYNLHRGFLIMCESFAVLCKLLAILKSIWIFPFEQLNKWHNETIVGLMLKYMDENIDLKDKDKPQLRAKVLERRSTCQVYVASPFLCHISFLVPMAEQNPTRRKSLNFSHPSRSVSLFVRHFQQAFPEPLV